MRRRRLALIVALLVVPVVMMMATGVPEEGVAAEIPPLTLISHQSPGLEYFAEEMGEFPETQLVTEFLPFSRYVNKIRIALSGRTTGYDIVWGDHQLIQEFAQNGWLLPLDRFVLEYGDELNFEDYSSSVWDALSYDGQIYAVPSSSNIWLLYVRKDLFEEAGLAYPPQTLDDVIKAARTLHQPGGRYGFATTLKRGINGANAIQYFLRLYGGSWVDGNMNPNFGGEAGLRTIETLQQLMQYAPPDVLTYNNNDVMNAVQQDRVAMVFLWASRAGSVNDSTESNVAGTVGFFLPPPASLGGKHNPLSFVTGYGISAYSQNDPRKIFRTIAYGTRRESQLEGAALQLPTRLPVLNDPTLQAEIPFFPAAAQGFEVGVYPAEMIPQASEYYDIVTAHFHEAIAGDTEPAVALENALREATEFLESR